MSTNASVMKIEWKNTVKWEVQHLLMFLFDFFVAIIKCSEKCARRDWSERVHHISIKHAP